jgi:hypothetical protein
VMEGPVEGDELLRPQSAQHRHLFLDHCPTSFEIGVQCVELDPVPTDADAEAKTTRGEIVHLDGLFRE